MSPIAPLKPCLAPRCPNLVASGRCPAHQRPRARDPRPSATQRGYGATWRKARRMFLRRHPLCVECGAPAVVVDHVVPHRGDPKLMWDQANWQSLCTTCHSRKTAREDTPRDDSGRFRTVGGSNRPGAGREDHGRHLRVRAREIAEG